MTRDAENKPKRYDDPEKVKADKAKARAADDLIKADLKQLMALPAFRRFVWRLLDWTHVFRSSFTGNSETFFREGERNIGLKVFGSVQEHEPDAYLVMVKENSKKDDS